MNLIKRLAASRISHLILLSIVVWSVFARTLGTYFLADDFGEISYASRIFNGEQNLLWANFIGNYMQIPGMAVWRPWLMISIFADFCIWRANPLGYFLTNLLSYNMVVLLLYSLIYTLARGAQEIRGRVVAVLAAALFAVSPLHCESVSWVVGRVDIVCAVFYLACLNLSLLAEKKLSQHNLHSYKLTTALAVLCFWLGMWTKEMAIGAPVMVTTMALLFSHKPLNFRYTLKLSAPLWLSVLIYFVLRYLALGTLLGGYVQGIGDSQAANAISRWMDPDTWRRLFLPFAYGIFGDHSWQQQALQFFFVILLALVLIRIISGSVSGRWAALLAVWIATCLAPLYKLWGIGYELEGARFCFFLTMPLALLAPALVMLPSRKRQLAKPVDRTLSALAIASSLCAMLILGKAAFLNNLEWVHAGQEVRELGRQGQKLSAEGHPDAKYLVLGIPKRRGGAHMVLNGATFVTALRPPFTDKDYSTPFITFDPVQFAECPFINSDRFKFDLNLHQAKVIVWNERHFDQVIYAGSKDPEPLILASAKGGYSHRLGGARAKEVKPAVVEFSNIQEGDSLAFSGLNLNPLDADFLEAQVTSLDSEPLQLGISFDDKSRGFYKSEPLHGNGLVRIPLSRDWHWFSQSNHDSLFLLLPPGRKLTITNCHLLKTKDVAPQISIGGSENYEGVTEISRQGKLPQALDLQVILPPLPDLDQVQVEVSKANSFYENFPENQGMAAVLSQQKFKIDAISALNHEVKVKLMTASFTPGCYHQIRVRLLKTDGSTAGELSCPITTH